jgi:sensor c-di-GMP phosphodiesterase-like protein
MKQRSMKILAVLGIMVAIALPIGLSIYLARHEGMEFEQARALSYARDVLARSETTADEIDAGFRLLEAGNAADPCSLNNIERMKRIDVTSSNIKAIGVVEGTLLRCSSLTGLGSNIEIGPADLVQPSGVRIWSSVELPFAQGVRFLVVVRGPYAAIVHKDLPLAASGVESGMSLATLSGPQRKVLTAHGVVDRRWIDALGGRAQLAFRDGGHVVAVVASRRYFIAALCALPVRALNDRIWSLAKLIVPVGVLMGLLLAGGVLYLARMQLAMPAMLKTALKRKEFFMVYQPVVDLRTGEWVGAEALIRWSRPHGETVRPDVFVVAAEDSGLIRQITKDVVVHQVCAHAAILFSRYPDFHIAINLASADLQSEGTIAMLRELVEATGARDGKLMIEATERSFAEPEVVRRIIDGLRSAGLRIAIDDFGTGYSSLSFLESIPFDLLKIDKSFVDTLDTGAAASQVVQHIIEMAKTLNLEMIAEGVETEAQADFLRRRGVQFAQGWLFAKPMSFENLLAELNGREAPGRQPARTGAAGQP